MNGRCSHLRDKKNLGGAFRGFLTFAIFLRFGEDSFLFGKKNWDMGAKEGGLSARENFRKATLSCVNLVGFLEIRLVAK